MYIYIYIYICIYTYIHTYIYNSEDGFTSWNKCNTFAIKGRFSSFTIATCNVYIDSLQHTATHCNTLQHTATHCNTLLHTATHCNTLRYQHCKTDIARNTSQQNSSKSVCAAMKATLLHNVVSRCMHKCCDACVAISMHVLQYRMTHRMHTRPQNTRNLNVARRTLQEIHGSKTPRGRCVQCNPKVHA